MKNILHLFSHFDDTGECPTSWSNEDLAEAMREIQDRPIQDEIERAAYFFVSGILAQRTSRGNCGSDWVGLPTEKEIARASWAHGAVEMGAEHFRLYAQEKIRSQPYF